MIIIVINNNLFLFWRKLTRKYDQMRLTWREKEWGTYWKMEKDEGILKFKSDSSSVWPSLEVEGAAGLVSSPRSLSFLHMSPGSVYLVTCSESIQNHSSDIKISCPDSREKQQYFSISFFFPSTYILASRGNHTCKCSLRAGDIFGVPSQSNEWKRNDWLLKWMNKCTNSSTAV